MVLSVLLAFTGEKIVLEFSGAPPRVPAYYRRISVLIINLCPHGFMNTPSWCFWREYFLSILLLYQVTFATEVEDAVYRIIRYDDSKIAVSVFNDTVNEGNDTT